MFSTNVGVKKRKQKNFHRLVQHFLFANVKTRIFRFPAVLEEFLFIIISKKIRRRRRRKNALCSASGKNL
jgi:hypothetical protein